MKIVSQGKKDKTNIQLYSCHKCGCVFEIDLCQELLDTCPQCGASHLDLENVTNEFKRATDFKPITADKAFPDKYYKVENPKQLNQAEIRSMIKSCFNGYKKDGGCYTYVTSGDTLVLITQNDKYNIDDYQVIVATPRYELDSFELNQVDEEEDDK